MINFRKALVSDLHIEESCMRVRAQRLILNYFCFNTTQANNLASVVYLCIASQCTYTKACSMDTTSLTLGILVTVGTLCLVHAQPVYKANFYIRIVNKCDHLEDTGGPDSSIISWK